MEEKKKKKLKLPPELEGKKFRIRKLCPSECFRLMGCDEETINTLINSGLSNSSLYRLAGNSIVVDVLYFVFKKMFVDTKQDVKKNQQLTLF